MRTFIRILNTVVWIITWTAICFSLILVLPKAAGINGYCVLSDSMAAGKAGIRAGDLAFIHTDRDNGLYNLMAKAGWVRDDTVLETGDIVTYKIGEQEQQVGIGGGISTTAYADTLVTHRIIRVTEDDDGNTLYETKGDNNSVSDANLVKESQIYGVYKYRIPKIGRLFIGGSAKIVLLTVLFLVSLHIIVVLLAWAFPEKTAGKTAGKPKDTVKAAASGFPERPEEGTKRGTGGQAKADASGPEYSGEDKDGE